MSETLSRGPVPIPANQVDYLLTTAGRAPSVHNTQPWRFRVSQYAIDLLADPDRRLRVDKAGREMVVSCGAALFGLRLAIRSLGYRPLVRLLPDPAELRLLARVSMLPGPPMTVAEHAMLDAVPHRHTHRGPFNQGPLPPGLLVGLQHDARAEGAALAFIENSAEYQRLTALISATSRRQDLDLDARQEVLRWSRRPGSLARDGIPARAFPQGAQDQPERLRQRDFDLGRGIGLELAGGLPPATTAILITLGDRTINWLRAGQSLQRMLLHAASKWVFASLYTQSLESRRMRALVAERLRLPGSPQALLQFGLAAATRPTSRRPAADLLSQ